MNDGCHQVPLRLTVSRMPEDLPAKLAASLGASVLHPMLVWRSGALFCEYASRVGGGVGDGSVAPASEPESESELAPDNVVLMEIRDSSINVRQAVGPFARARVPAPVAHTCVTVGAGHRTGGVAVQCLRGPGA